MFQIQKEIQFPASHRLYKGGRTNEQDHSHLWKVIATIKSEELDINGFVIDYDLLGKLLEEITTPFHKKSLNNVPPFTLMNPTAENFAKVLFQKLDHSLDVYNRQNFGKRKSFLYSITVFKDQDIAVYSE